MTTNNDDEMKTSEEWQKLKPVPKVIDPDGWDRQNFLYSWYEELITEQEYGKRLYRSTVMHKKGIKDEIEEKIWELIKTLEYHAEGTGEAIEGNHLKRVTILKQNIFVHELKQLIASREKRVAEEIFKDLEKILDHKDWDGGGGITGMYDNKYKELHKKYLTEGES